MSPRHAGVIREGKPAFGAVSGGASVTAAAPAAVLRIATAGVASARLARVIRLGKGGVGDLESGLLQSFHIVDDGSVHELRARRVDEQAIALARDHFVI